MRAGSPTSGDATGAAPDGGAAEAAADQAYFQAVEEIFVGLRGAPLLLSPADWHTARGWHRQGVPLGVVREALEEVFARRRERGGKVRLNTLRYCGPAVEAAWKRHSELAAPGGQSAAAAFDAPGRLRRLAAALRLELPAAAAVASLAEEAAAAAADPEEIESRLADIDREVLDAAWDGLAAAERAAVEDQVRRTMAALADRLPATEVEPARQRLLRQVLRARLGMPVLSLFSPEALEPAPEAGEGVEAQGPGES